MLLLFPKPFTEEGIITLILAFLLFLKYFIARSRIACAELALPKRSSQCFNAINPVPKFCPVPEKLRP